MTKATNTAGPVGGHPYAVIVLTGGFDVERFNFKEPLDALIAGLRYLREGRQVRLTDRTCAALKEAEPLAVFDKMANGHDVPTGPTTVTPLFKAADNA